MALVLDGTNGETFPSWTTAGRPASPVVGQMGYNTTIGQFDVYTASGWTSLLATTSTSNKITASQLPAGSVLQVVQSVYSGSTVTAYTSTPVATGLSVSITPTSSSSKILIICNPNWAINSAGSNDGTGLGAIYRNATSIYSMICRVYSYFGASGNYTNNAQSLVYLDSPATTSATTYQFYISLLGGSGTQFQGDGLKSSITVLEIAA